MREGETVNESETVNQSQSAAGGSGEKPEKLVADFVESSWEHITENGFDLLADVAVDTLVKNGAVPSDAYLHSVKTSWCLHRAAVHYARQYSVERVAADFARGDAQFEYSLRAQAERKAEKLEADLAQSVLLVENLRLRIDEADTANQELRQKLDTAEAALLEQQQQKRAQCIEAQNVLALWGETRRRCEELETLVADLQTANAAAEAAKAAAEAALLDQQQRNEALVTQGSQQRMNIAELEQQVRALVNQKQKISERLDAEMEVCRKLTKRLRCQELKKQTQTQTQPQPQPEPVPVQVCEGRWRTRGGDIRNVTPTPSHDSRAKRWPWRDAEYDQTWGEGGLSNIIEKSSLDLVEYLGPIEEQSGSEQIAS